MSRYPSFDEHYRPRIQHNLQRHVTRIKRKVNQAKQSNNANEAERMLDQACQECVQTVQSEVNKIRESIKRRRPSNICSQKENESYNIFVQAAAVGIQEAQGMFTEILSRLRKIVSTVIDWIREGLAWVGSTIEDAFSAIQSFFQ